MKRKREAREIFDEEAISELTGEILLTLSQTEGDRVMVGCSEQGGFMFIPVRGQGIEIFAFQVKKNIYFIFKTKMNH